MNEGAFPGFDSEKIVFIPGGVVGIAHKLLGSLSSVSKPNAGLESKDGTEITHGRTRRCLGDAKTKGVSKAKLRVVWLRMYARGGVTDPRVEWPRSRTLQRDQVHLEQLRSGRFSFVGEHLLMMRGMH